MLVQFSVGNFLSFKDRVTLSMVAAPIKEFQGSNTFSPRQDLELTKAAVIYGANASGKSNLMHAMRFMEMFVRQSVERLHEGAIPWIQEFKLSEDTDNKPSFFEIVVLLEGTIYRYGFEADRTRIVNEWLYRQVKRKEDQLFLRTNSRDIDLDGKHFNEGKGLKEKTRDNALFLTVAAQFNGAISSKIINWFLKHFFVIDPLQDGGLSLQTKKKALNDSAFRAAVGNLLKIADFGIESISAAKVDVTPLPLPFPADFPPAILERINEERSIQISTLHQKYNTKEEVIGSVPFDLFGQESAGTRQFFCLLGPVFSTLVSGGVLIVDELDTSIHSRLVWKVVKLFNSVETNPNNAQLIFTTHDTTLLSQELLRRDQMWFVEKDKIGSSKLYSLVDYKKRVRNDASYERDYLKGKYGAVPNIGSELDQFVASLLTKTG